MAVQVFGKRGKIENKRSVLENMFECCGEDMIVLVEQNPLHALEAVQVGVGGAGQAGGGARHGTAVRAAELPTGLAHGGRVVRDQVCQPARPTPPHSTFVSRLKMDI